MKAPYAALMGLFCFTAFAAEPGKTGSDNRLRSAIQTRCMQECDWLKSYCDKGAFAFCKGMGSGCLDRCVKKSDVSRAMSFRSDRHWGRKKDKAIEVCMPEGERRFILDLRCPDGKVPSFKRTGSVGPRNQIPSGKQPDLESMMNPMVVPASASADYHIVDLYELACGGTKHKLYFDMYHCATPKPWAAPRGFTRPLPR